MYKARGAIWSDGKDEASALPRAHLRREAIPNSDLISGASQVTALGIACIDAQAPQLAVVTPAGPDRAAWWRLTPDRASSSQECG
jgi:hypothetical protein